MISDNESNWLPSGEDERRFEALIEKLAGRIVVVDADGRYRYVSSSVEHSLGYEPGDLVGENAFDYIHPDDRARVRSAFEQALATPDETYTIEYRYRHEDGGWRWVETTTNNQLDNPAIGGFIGNSHDITGRKEREQELARVRERFQAFQENASDLLSVLDRDGFVQYASPSVERILGYSQEELVGENAFDYIHPDDRDHAWETFAATVEQPEPVTDRAEYRFEHADGSWVWLESVGSNRTHTAIDGFVITSRDFSKRKEYERELERQKDRLEQFASIVSHELRNPLTVARGWLDLYRDEGRQEHLDDVDTALDRIGAIVEDVLALARYGDEVTDVDDVSLRELAEDAWSSVENDAATLHVSEPPGTIVGDRERIVRLLENLFRNAIDHGGDDVSVWVGELSDGDGFYVEDDGSGILGADPDRIFEWGYSGGSDGHGFGLATVAHIVEVHGWTIRAPTGRTGGARFEIRTDRGTGDHTAADS